MLSDQDTGKVRHGVGSPRADEDKPNAVSARVTDPESVDIRNGECHVEESEEHHRDLFGIKLREREHINSQKDHRKNSDNNGK